MIYLYRLMYHIQKWLLTRRGWNLGHNVQVSFHGVKKLGGGKKYSVKIIKEKIEL